MRLVLLVFLALAACKKTEPRNLAPDAGDELRARPQELAYVTLKVVGMT